ncbi:MAG: response regulator [Anaerolineales bacterium]|nr:response regulator [Anaerolineales bacterium]
MASPLALVVEDDRALARSFQIALQGAGFEVHLADTARLALDLVNALRPCLVVLDLHLIDEDELPTLTIQPRLVRECRAIGAQIVAVTGDPRLAEYLQADFDLVLYKPVSTVQLRVLARRLCRIKGTADLLDAPR